MPLFKANWNLHGHGVELELFADALDAPIRIRTHAVKLVDEGKAWNPVALHLAVHREGL